jgi:mono/diheme cytochrome c family protein
VNGEERDPTKDEEMERSRWFAVSGTLLLSCALIVPPSLAAAEQSRAARVDHQSGAFLFRTFCISCHGETGKGDGPVADLLKQPPGDLTQIARRAGGVFPRDVVIRKIDGRTAVPAHGKQDMPIWGDALKTTEGQDERLVRQRIEAIASHLESIQVR